MLVSVIVADDELAVGVELSGARVDRVELLPGEVRLNRACGANVETAVVGGSAVGGIRDPTAVGVDRAVDVPHPADEEDLTGLDTRGVGGLEPQRGLGLVSGLSLVDAGATALIPAGAPVTDRRVLSTAAVDHVGGVVLRAGRVADAGARPPPLPRVRGVGISIARNVGNRIGTFDGAHIGDLHGGVAEGNIQITGGCVRERRRPRERHHGHQNNGKGTDHRKESAQESFTPTPWAD